MPSISASDHGGLSRWSRWPRNSGDGLSKRATNHPAAMSIWPVTRFETSLSSTALDGVIDTCTGYFKECHRANDRNRCPIPPPRGWLAVMSVLWNALLWNAVERVFKAVYPAG